jgi:hypothetical protein
MRAGYFGFGSKALLVKKFGQVPILFALRLIRFQQAFMDKDFKKLFQVGHIRAGQMANLFGFTLKTPIGVCNVWQC